MPIRLFLITALLIIVVMVGRIGIHHYQAIADDFEGSLPSALLTMPERTGLSGLRTVELPVNGATVSAWYLPSRNRATIIVAHGANDDRASMLAEIRLLQRAGFGVIAFDWPGHGLSTGQVDWGTHTRAAMVAVLDWLVQQPEVDPRRIGALGFSMGGYMTAEVVADDERIAAVVLEAAPADYLEYLRWHHQRWGRLSEWPAKYKLRHSGMSLQMTPLQAVSHMKPRPLLVIAGQTDKTVPAFMVHRIYSAAQEPKQWWEVPGAGHGHYATAAPQAYERRLVDFFKAALLAKS